MLSSDLAALYQVEVRALIQAVKRNNNRFPEDFAFQLNADEVESLRSQNVILNAGKRGSHIKYLPCAFTQEGIAMLSSVLRSERAVDVNVAIMRAFVKLRDLMNSHKELAKKIESLERRYDGQFKVVFNSIRKLIDVQPKEVMRISSNREKSDLEEMKKDNSILTSFEARVFPFQRSKRTTVQEI